jgi:hypothetical protein
MVILYGYPDPKYLKLYKLGRAIHLDPQLRERFRKDTESVMNEFGLSEEEKELVRSADPVKMFKAGISPYTIAGSSQQRSCRDTDVPEGLACRLLRSRIQGMR